MEIVYIDYNYTDFLRATDSRVTYNSVGYKRPYVGVVFEVLGNKYFAPMTSSSKGKKLRLHPKLEDLTFLPINNCRHGGINFNNMIPVVKGVYKLADMVIKTNDTEKDKKYKVLLAMQWFFISRNRTQIIQKAQLLYNLKTKGHLPHSPNSITCDFKKLEAAAQNYKKPKP